MIGPASQSPIFERGETRLTHDPWQIMPAKKQRGKFASRY
jgi:hypothetical protein